MGGQLRISTTTSNAVRSQEKKGRIAGAVIGFFFSDSCHRENRSDMAGIGFDMAKLFVESFEIYRCQF